MYCSRTQHIGTSKRPALVALGTLVVLSWRGQGGDSHIWGRTYDGVSFPQAMEWQRQDPQTGTTEGPAVAVLGGSLLRYWKGSGDNFIWTATSMNEYEVAPRSRTDLPLGGRASVASAPPMRSRNRRRRPGERARRRAVSIEYARSYSRMGGSPSTGHNRLHGVHRLPSMARRSLP